LVIIPLSFNIEPYFTFTSGMLKFDPDAYSLRWYEDFINNTQWIHSVKNSFIIAIASTILATVLGTLAALGLSKPHMPYRSLMMGLLISPMIVPLIISAAGMYFFYSNIGLSQTYLGIILAHTALGTPFVVITVTATLVGFDHSLSRASANLGANPTTTFFKVIMPLILPGVISGALFAFITSFDEVVVVLFLAGFDQRTIPRQMWSGIREQISPTILAVATILVMISIALLATLELLRRRGEKMRGMSPG
jgi:putative spermidine/putrescine transport system permease protein